MKYSEIIADRLSKTGSTLGWVSALDSERRTLRIVDAHRGDGKRFVVHADEKLTAFLELEAATEAEQPIASGMLFLRCGVAGHSGGNNGVTFRCAAGDR